VPAVSVNQPGPERNAYYRERRARARVEWLALFDSRCVDCGAVEGDVDPVIGRKVKLEADHENPDEKETRRPDYADREYNSRVGRRETSLDIFSRRKEFRDRELAKCRPRCQRCHNQRTSERRAQAAEEVPF
jgi:hypothetical protein